MTVESISLDKIRLDGETQPRGTLSQQQIRNYAEDMKAGMTFPPVELCHDGRDYWLWDGFHRVHATRLVGFTEIDANVTSGTQTDAQWLSYGANTAHGLYRSNEDKRRAVLAALSHPKAEGLSNPQVAKHCGVSTNTAAKYREELEATCQIDKSTRRTGRDGRTIDTANIGRSNAKPARRGKSIRISPRALKPVRGHSKPDPKTTLELPHDPVYAARALMSVFDSDYLRKLVRELTNRLEGEAK